jgi:hypothetical protein
MRHLTWAPTTAAIVLLAAALLGSGCAASGQAESPTSPVMAGMSMTSGQVMTPAPAPTRPATSAAMSAAPTATALMVCGSDISGKITQILKLDRPATTHSTFTAGRYSCTYDLPVGPLVLAVQQSPTKAQANSYFRTLRPTLGLTEDQPGLGEQAYSTPTGTVVVIKDSQTLTVDATALPAVFGSQDQKRTDLAYEVASDVLGCWTGDE